ncbi:flavodoxin domain-containing protein [Ruficoccus amylovorans]|uniref:Flavodoxin domain-containing protein n=1 Tax=Ruficoccus amylovorans TaxID=1804625 RepID=A0A842HJN9_9BACT|nr:flavodoxin domain-containing protein [Ruficoccus amylovorans]MBC2596178.1 flavodoxin domain-containing protein [Ruficoccus amylovorans]
MQSQDSTLHIIFGTMTGNSEDLANRLAGRCKNEGIAHTICSAEEWPLERFSEVRRVILIFSTWGDGEPPDDAIDFCESLYDQKAEVAHLDYMVIGLGDTSYDDFCGCARRLDEALEAGGAKRMSQRLDLDIDFDKDFDAWTESFIAGELALQRL